MRYRVVIWFLAAVPLVGVFAGCKKKTSKPGPAVITWTAGADIYFVGYDSSQAVYWKNGVETVLGRGEGQGIALSGGSVYVGGVDFKSGGGQTLTQAALWKDGVEQDLDTASSWGYAPVVSGTDVYVPGFINRPAPQAYPVYWKNGQRVYLDSTAQGEATEVAISGTDVYVVGEVTGSQFDTLLVWKDGRGMTGDSILNEGPYGQIEISGGNMYVLFNEGYFVNAAKQDTIMQGAFVLVNMFFNGPDIYTAGRYLASSGFQFAACWKNGVMDTLPNYPGTVSSYATAVLVAGSDVYVTGAAEVGATSLAVYWKNGVEATLAQNGAVCGAALGN